jgi:hypothetical protein
VCSAIAAAMRTRVSVNISIFRDRFDDWVVGSQLDPSCLHHPVSRNRQLIARWQKGRFCGHFSREVVSDFLSLCGDIVSEALSARQSPAAKIPFLAAGWRNAIATTVKALMIPPI